MSTKIQATIENLYGVDGKAEIVNGELILMSPTGRRPNRAAGRIFRSLDDYERATGNGYAFTDNMAFVVNVPGRKSFSPDVAFYVGTVNWDDDEAGDFLEGAPVFAVEVRSKNDYGNQTEKKLAAKRADYFTAGSLVVWDVDVLKEKLIRVYRAADPKNPTVYRQGDIAEAEPALPGWTLPVDDLFA